jgi:alpha-ketoglutarate-dependent taurine dioxygenase
VAGEGGMTTAVLSRAKITPLAPFGVEIAVSGPADLDRVDEEQIRSLLNRHKIVLLRGFDSLDKEAFADQARRFGPLLEWNFGHVLDLVVHEEPQNYLFTKGNVPFHWDGAFAKVVPGIQFFQCLEAPDPGSGGETLFCNTAGVIDRASLNDRSAWQRIEIAYQTEKKAHYGGAIRQSLIDRHPSTGETIIRFAEPLNEESVKLNPLYLDIFDDDRQLGIPETEAFLSSFIPQLYEPEIVYAHRWQSGDYLLADNHALLHGRRAFFASSRRHIRRIHVI